MKMKLNDKTISYKVKRKKRKTISIKIDEYGEVIIRCPLYIDDERVKQIIQDKAEWIISRINLIQYEKISKIDKLDFLGKEHKFNIYESANSNIKIIFNKSEFQIYFPKTVKENRDERIRDALIKWYRAQARVILEERTKYYSEVLKVNPNRIAIKDQKTRWGSCSSKGNINYNYRIIMAPIEIIDYLVVHELCHLIELNHSKKFWSLVQSILPNYQDSLKWLKLNGNNIQKFERIKSFFN